MGVDVSGRSVVPGVSRLKVAISTFSCSILIEVVIGRRADWTCWSLGLMAVLAGCGLRAMLIDSLGPERSNMSLVAGGTVALSCGMVVVEFSDFLSRAILKVTVDARVFESSVAKAGLQPLRFDRGGFDPTSLEDKRDREGSKAKD